MRVCTAKCSIHCNVLAARASRRVEAARSTAGPLPRQRAMGRSRNSEHMLAAWIAGGRTAVALMEREILAVPEVSAPVFHSKLDRP